MTKIPIHSNCYGLPSEKDRALRTEERPRFVLGREKNAKKKSNRKRQEDAKKVDSRNKESIITLTLKMGIPERTTV